MVFKPFDTRPSLSDQVYETIKKSILSLELQPGKVLSIGDLADQFQISRTPVRDALLLLEKEELVTLIPHKGAKVSEITAQDVQEMYELRIVLESYAVRVATSHLTTADLEKLEYIIQASHQAMIEQEYLLASDIGRQLHDVLIQKVTNRRLITYLHELDILYTRLRHLSALMNGRLEKSHHQHLSIVQALKEGSAPAAEQAMSQHLQSVCDDILDNLDTWMGNLVSQAHKPAKDKG